MNAQEFSFLTFLLELIRNVNILDPLLSVTVNVWSTFPDVEVGNKKRSRTDLMYFLFSVVSSRKK